MSKITEQNTFTADVARLIMFIHESGWAISFGETWRPDEMHFVSGKSTTMKNSHGDRLAVDLNFFDMSSGEPTLTYKKELLQKFGDYWQSLDKKNVWGGNWKDKNGNPFLDTPHFERRV
jgi:hypothetical protein